MVDKQIIREFSLRAKSIDIDLGKQSILIHEDDSRKIGVKARERLKIFGGGEVTFAIVYITTKLVQPGEIGILSDLTRKLDIDNGDKIVVSPMKRPESINYIRKKLYGKTLTRDEIFSLVKDITEYRTTDIELSALISAITSNGMDMNEIEYFTKAMVSMGKKLELNAPRIFDKHSIGGVPGDKTTLLVVPIVAAGGLVIPKTSSRAITSAAGTADVMEVIARTDFNADEIAEIVRKTNGCLVWGGAIDLVPADSILIDIERPLSLDPEGLILASVLGKKKAVGTNYVVIDLPTGNGCKVETKAEARNLAIKFIELGQRLDMHVECAITFGGQPIGRAVGPALEAKEALMALEGERIGSLIEKATGLAGILLELGHVAPQGKGKAIAQNILESGKALEKFREIIEAQGGDANIKSDDIELAENVETITSKRDGYVTMIRNPVINKVARIAGAPLDKKAGVLLHAKKGERVGVGDPLISIYSSNSADLDAAVKYAVSENIIAVEGMVLQRVNVI